MTTRAETPCAGTVADVLASNHVLAGSAVALLVRRPSLALAAGVISHLALDVVPHWGVDQVGPAGRDTWLRVARVDGVCAAALLAACALHPRRRLLLAGALGGLSFDVQQPTSYLLGRNALPRPLRVFHARIQRGRDDPSRLGAEVVAGAVVAGAVLTMLARLNTRARR